MRVCFLSVLLLPDKICALGKICFLENKTPGEDRGDKLCRTRERGGYREVFGRWNVLELDGTLEMMRVKQAAIYDDYRVSHLGN